MNKGNVFLTICFFICLLLFSVEGKAEDLYIVGTGSGMILLKKVADVFNQQNSDVKIIVPPSIGSGGGIRAVGNDENVLGRIARDIKDKEKRYGLRAFPIAKIPVVIFVNKSVTLNNISTDQVLGIFGGAVKRWEEILGGNGKTRVIVREEGDSSQSILKQCVPGFKDLIITERSLTVYTDQSNAEQCAHYKNAVAYGAFPDVIFKTGVKPLALNGIKPENPRYPCTGVLSLIYKSKNYKGAVKHFIEFIGTGPAKKAVMEAGGIPVEK